MASLQAGKARRLQKAVEDHPAAVAALAAQGGPAVPAPAVPEPRPAPAAEAAPVEAAPAVREAEPDPFAPDQLRLLLANPVPEDDDSPLGERELLLLDRCNQEIDRWKSTFYTAGMALELVATLRLYKGRYKTFAEFAEVEHDLKTSHAHRLRDAARIAHELGESGRNVLESHLRPLGQVARVQGEAVAAEVYRELARQADRKVTGKMVEAVAAALPRKAFTGLKGSLTEPEIKEAVSASLNGSEPAPAKTVPGKVVKEPARVLEAFQKTMEKQVGEELLRAAQAEPEKAREVVRSLREQLDALLAELDT